jgi:hypothetical protein
LNHFNKGVGVLQFFCFKIDFSPRSDDVDVLADLKVTGDQRSARLHEGVVRHRTPGTRVARFFFVQTYQNGKKPKDDKLHQTAMYYTKWL